MEHLLFLDESGSHNLTVIDPNYPVFVLGGVIVDRVYAETELPERLQAFKRDLFGNENLILHTADLTRNRNGFEAMKEASFRAHCYAQLNRLMRELEYRVVACVIKKDGHLSRYGVSALDPYMFSLEILVERFALEIGDHWHSGEIVAECRSPEAWENLRVQGSRFLSATEIRNRIVGVTTRPKRAKRGRSPARGPGGDAHRPVRDG